MSATAHPDGGFTLVEVLVAWLVLSVGLLGVAALQLESLRSSRAALLRTQAVLLTTDMADRIRANRVPADAYDCGGPCGTGAGGNAIAVADLADWHAAVAAALPAGRAEITLAAGVADAPVAYVVGVGWLEGNARAESTFQLRVER